VLGISAAAAAIDTATASDGAHDDRFPEISKEHRHTYRPTEGRVDCTVGPRRMATRDDLRMRLSPLRCSETPALLRSSPMQSLRACIAICGAALLISGCSGSKTSVRAEQTAAQTTAAAAIGAPEPSTPATPTTSPPPKSPAEVTAACPFLSVSELTQFLGHDADGQIVYAAEDTPQKNAGGIQVNCDYRGDGSTPYSLTISAYPASGLSVADLVDAVPADAQNVRKLSGIGQAAIYYTTADGFGVYCAGTLSHGQARAATFIAPEPLPQTTFADVVQLVVARL
jgi:hypothetical protein